MAAADGGAVPKEKGRHQKSSSQMILADGARTKKGQLVF
jgi:hypothetical protein